MNELMRQIIAAAGQPVSASTLTAEHARQAAAEGRRVDVCYWSTMGDGEAWFAFTATAHFSFDGSASGVVSGPAYPPEPSVLAVARPVPRPIPIELRRSSTADGETIDEIRQASPREELPVKHVLQVVFGLWMCPSSRWWGATRPWIWSTRWNAGPPPSKASHTTTCPNRRRCWFGPAGQG